MNIDERFNLGFATGALVFFVVYIALAILYGGWGFLLGWIAALLAAALTVYFIYRFEPLARAIDIIGKFMGAMLTALSLPRV